MRFVAAVLTIVFLALPAHAGLDLRPHRAVYDMERLKRDNGSAFAQVGGRMVYHYDRTCEGTTYNHRMLLDLISAQGNAIRSETILSFYETADGKVLRFQVRELVNETPIVELEGKAVRASAAEPATITYSKREGAKGDPIEALPGNVLFPLQHTDDLIRAALDGAITHNARTFDGDELSQVDSFIQPAKSGGTEDAVLPESMAGMKSWITRVSFFKLDARDSAPFYETQMRFWENGLSGDFTMETDDLAVVARLKEVELYDQPVCK
ncbi:MAG: EipB family protein [Minwuia sp.]|uniref:EipB family protein n=1 Tax=Minwuia sp. TaxID=2493630 RepID=UPI003A859492